MLIQTVINRLDTWWPGESSNFPGSDQACKLVLEGNPNLKMYLKSTLGSEGELI